MNWFESDRKFVWHPFTQMQTAPLPIPVESAKDEFLFTSDGRKIIDGISSWWVTLHGHSHPTIVRAIQAQVEKLDQVIYAGFAHEQAAKLSQRLVGLWDHKLEKVFFSDDGSTAVEVAVKLSVQSRINSGKPNKIKIIALENAYHGDTLGAMSVGARSSFTSAFNELMFDVIRIPAPVADSGTTTEEHKFKCLTVLKNLLEKDHESISALIVEPIVQGAGGMLMWADGALSEMRNLTRQFDVHLIADEIMVGFGRTGKMFASQHEQIFPDIACLSKGLTGGFLPMSVTMCTQEIYNQFLSEDRMKTFFHGHSYTANPIACAAANASLDVWENENPFEKIQKIENYHRTRISEYKTHSNIADVRIKGTIFAIEIKQTDGGYFSQIGPKLYEYYLKNEILLRPLGNVIYIMPPFCISEESLKKCHDVLLSSLDLV